MINRGPWFRIDFPPFLLLMTMMSLLVSAIGFDNQAKLVSSMCPPLRIHHEILIFLFKIVANNFIPPIHVLLPARYRYRSPSYPPYLANLLSNPYTLAPLFFCTSLFGTYLFVPSYVALLHYLAFKGLIDKIHRFQHREFDLLLAAVETIVTSYLAYPAAVALGSILLQTAPSRGLPGARMEAFLRAMREVRHFSLSFVHVSISLTSFFILRSD